MTVGYEDLPPGTAIPVHKHLMDEEVLFLHQGEVKVILGDRKQEVKQGAKDGLPIGVQLIGPYWSEPELLHIARRLAPLTKGFVAPQGF